MPWVMHEWQRVHEELIDFAKTSAMRDAEEAKLIIAAFRLRPDLKLGFASFSEYLDRWFGWGLKVAREKTRVAAALEVLPEIARALASGEIHWSCARELTRVAILETETIWLDVARGLSMRQIEELVSGREKGDRPSDPRKLKLEEHTIHVKVSGETMALWRGAMSSVRKAGDCALSDDEIIQTIARAALGGPTDEGRASYQIVINRCPDCGRASQRGSGRELPIDAAALETAECDSQCIDMHAPGIPRATQQIPPATRRFVLHRDHHRCVVPGCRFATFVDVHHLHPKSEGGDHHPDRLATMCSNHHKQAHVGRLIIEGDFTTGLTFKHADGTPYGTNMLNAETTSTMTDLFSAL
jgi:5-methylcytosine-specific restriction endonuclease McrA